MESLGIVVSCFGGTTGGDPWSNGGGAGRSFSVAIEWLRGWYDPGVGKGTMLSSRVTIGLSFMLPSLTIPAETILSCLRLASMAFARAALAGNPSISLPDFICCSAIAGSEMVISVGFSVFGLSSESSAISFSRCWPKVDEDDFLELLDWSIAFRPSADSDNSSAVVKEKTVSWGVKVSRTDWKCTARRTVACQLKPLTSTLR